MNSFESWCRYQIEDIEADVISTDRTAIRMDFVKGLNDVYMEEVDGRAERMVWAIGTHLHIENISNLMMVEPDEMIQRYKKGIDDFKHGRIKDDYKYCLYGAIFHFFDQVIIHSRQSKYGGEVWINDPTTIKTGRREFYKDAPTPAIRRMVDKPDF